jgi:hypothetical protein
VSTERPAAPEGEVYRVIAEWQSARVRDALGREYRTTSTRVVVRKPGWMPDRTFRWLMRCIVLQERPEPALPWAVRRKTKMRTR